MSRLKPNVLPEFDLRRAVEPLAASKARESAASELRENVPGVQIDFDAITGAPSNIMALGMFLSGPNQADEPNGVLLNSV